MQHYVFIVSYKAKCSNRPLGTEIFDFFIKRNIWVVHERTHYWKLMQPKDKALFYLAGKQVFLGAATIMSNAQAFPPHDDMRWFKKKNPRKLLLSDIKIFQPPISRQVLSGAIDWKPLQGACVKISPKDFGRILQQDKDRVSSKIKTN
mgnify:CR=1 FL=1